MVDPHPAPTPGRLPPDLLDGLPYTLIKHLGAGAHGVVVEAEQIALRRRVVIKLLHAQHAGSEQIADRLRLEAQAIAALAPRTPNVAQILDFGRTAAGRPYIVMERLDGRTLEDELAARGALPPVEAVDIAVQILDGLAAAHDAGIVHRDVKPANVFLCPSPAGGHTVKLLDFGLAKVVRDAAGARGPAPLVMPTEDGTMMGSPLYFSPEQARGQAATPLSDLYATGAVLYTMLAGREPFARDNIYVLVKAHLLDAPQPLSTAAPQPIPEALDRAVLQALAKRPEDRHESARAFRAVLERAVRSAPRRWAATERMDQGIALPSSAAATRIDAQAPAAASRARRLLSLGLRVFAASVAVGAAVTLAVYWKPRALPPQNEARGVAAASALPVAAEQPTAAASPPPVVTPEPLAVEPPPLAPPPSAAAPRAHASVVQPKQLPALPLPGIAPPPPRRSNRVFGTDN